VVEGPAREEVPGNGAQRTTDSNQDNPFH
jgi:hypothetical protein